MPMVLLHGRRTCSAEIPRALTDTCLPRSHTHPTHARTHTRTTCSYTSHAPAFQIKADGHCLFRAVSHQLSTRCGVTATVEDLRRGVAAHILANSAELGPFLPYDDTDAFDTDPEGANTVCAVLDVCVFVFVYFVFVCVFVYFVFALLFAQLWPRCVVCVSRMIA